jgi:type I restriction enzyme S subunit
MPERTQSLPDGWRWVRLGDVCDRIDYGFTASADFSIGEPRFLRITDIQKGFVNWETVPGCEITTEEEGANRLTDGDIVFARTGATTGKSFLIRKPPRAVFASYLIRLRLKFGVIPSFIYCFFQSEDYWKQIRANARGGAQPNVNATLLSEIAIPLPPLEEQKRIAAILNEQMGAVERARAAAEAQLEAAKALPTAYLRAVFSNPEAQQWPMSQLGELCEIQLGKMLSPASKTGVRPRPYLRNANVQWGKFDLADISQMDFTEDQERKFTLIPGDLLVCEGGEPGRAAVWEGQIPSCLYQKAIHRLRPINSAIDPHFVMYRLWMGAFQHEFVESQAKTTIAHLPAVRLQQLPIRVPTVSEQRRIAAMLNEQMASLERTRKAIEEELDAINKLPGAVLRRAFAGEL